jgi:outer membrane protein OmpA-like peptidoglycan-associated protein
MNEDGIWDQVHKLPRSINSTGREMSPFIHFDGRTLYFVSERSPSLGGSDFFKTSKLNDSTWSEPVNLGFPLNSFNDEFSMIVEPAGQLAYFSSNRGAELILINQRLSELDLYQCVLPESMRPTPTFNYQAWVVDSITGEPVGKASVQFYNRSEAAFFSGFSAEFTGKVSVMSPVEEMRITAYKKGYLPYSNTVTLLEWLAWSPSRNEIKLVPLASRRSFTLRNVLFELDKSSLLPESEKELNILYRLLHDEPEYKAQIIGHTDDQGTRSYNQRLSEARAETVKNWLIEKGIDSNRLISSGRGMDVPVASNQTEEGRALNRRTEVQLF